MTNLLVSTKFSYSVYLIWSRAIRTTNLFRFIVGSSTQPSLLPHDALAFHVVPSCFQSPSQGSPPLAIPGLWCSTRARHAHTTSSRVDRSPTQFPEQLYQLLHDEEWVATLTHPPEGELGELIGYLDNVRSTLTQTKTHLSPVDS